MQTWRKVVQPARRSRSAWPWSGSEATDRLRDVVIAYREATREQTATIVRLTWAMVALTALLLIGLIVQIALAVT